LTQDSQPQKYAQTVVSTQIATGSVQFLGEEKRFRTAWAKSRRSRQLWNSCIAEQLLQSHAARDGCEAIEFAEATYLVASIS
jgi:hypothetical protein